MAAPGLHDAPCFAIDLLLARTIEWRELHNLMTSAGYQPPEVAPEGMGAEAVSVAHAHQLVHKDGAFARLLDRRLDLHCDRMLRTVRGTEAHLLSKIAKTARTDASEEVLALLWALYRDERVEVSRLGRWLATRLQYAALDRFLASSAPAEAHELEETT